MYRIKICGITNPEDALAAASAGADALGLNFFARSSRYVAPRQARAIVRAVRQAYSPAAVQLYGVFVNATLQDLRDMLREAGLSEGEPRLGIQLHGDEPPEMLRDLRREGRGDEEAAGQGAGAREMTLVRALRCRDEDAAGHTAYLRACQELGALPDAVLLDAYAPHAYGGTGETLDWAAVAARRATWLGLPLVLAGGLTPDNVAAAIALARPDGVDVASGVEAAPGRKDPVKMQAFIASARQALRWIHEPR